MKYKLEEIDEVLSKHLPLATAYYYLTNGYEHSVEAMAALCHRRNNDNWKQWYRDVAKPYIETKFKNSQIEVRLKEIKKDF